MKLILPLIALSAASLACADQVPDKAGPAAACAACAHCAPAAPAPLAAPAFSRESIYQLDAHFTDDSGRTVTLGELRGRPVVINMFFASCGYACPLLVSNMQTLRAQLPAGLREHTAFVLVSFDTVRDTPAALAQYRAQRALDGQWTLLHGDASVVRELAALLGVKYKQESDGMFSHSNVLTVLNAQGEIVHQRIGLQGGLDEAAAALVAACK